MIERGAVVDDFEDEEEGQSEDDSNVSEGDKTKGPNKTPGGKPDTITPGLGGGKNTAFQSATVSGATPLTQQNPLMGGVTGAAGVDYTKILVAGEGFGREFLKNEIDRLIKMLQDKQQVGQGIHTFVRIDGPRKGWEEDNN